MPNTFAGRAAYFLGELNAAHPFREGRAPTAEETIEASQLSHRSGDFVFVRSDD